MRSAPLRSASLRSAPLRSASMRSAPMRSAPLRSASSPARRVPMRSLILRRKSLLSPMMSWLRLALWTSSMVSSKVRSVRSKSSFPRPSKYREAERRSQRICLFSFWKKILLLRPWPPGIRARSVGGLCFLKRPSYKNTSKCLYIAFRGISDSQNLRTPESPESSNPSVCPASLSAPGTACTRCRRAGTCTTSRSSRRPRTCGRSSSRTTTE